MVRTRTYLAIVADLAAEKAKRELLEQRVDELSVERGKREVLEKHVDAQAALMTFICGRINQLEIERAVLVRKLTNVEIPVPQFTATARTKAAPGELTGSPLQGAALFEDMGDELAKQMGIRWDASGRVVYAGDEEQEESAHVSTE